MRKSLLRHLVLVLLFLGLLVWESSPSQVASWYDQQILSSILDDYQWDDQQVAATPFWAAGIQGEEVVVAVIDSGVDPGHPALSGRVIDAYDVNQIDRDCAGVDLYGTVIDPNDTTDCFGHGTHVAGIVAAGRDPGSGIQGVAPLAEILSIKAFALGKSPYPYEWRDRVIEPGYELAFQFWARGSFIDASLTWTDPDKQLSLYICSPESGRCYEGERDNGNPASYIRHTPRRGEFNSMWYVTVIGEFASGTETFDLVIDHYDWFSVPLDVAAAINYAIDWEDNGKKVDIINLSLSTGVIVYSEIIEAILRAVDHGIIVVAAAGNAGCLGEPMTLPGSRYEIITVGANDANGQIAAFSTRGPCYDKEYEEWITKPDVVAPGGQVNCDTLEIWDFVYSTMSRDDRCDWPWSPEFPYAGMVGTSQAAPQVAGLAALLAQYQRDYFDHSPQPMEVKALLQNAAVDQVGNPQGAVKDNDYGAGRVNGRRAYLSFPFYFPSVNPYADQELYVWLPDYLPANSSYMPLKGTLNWRSLGTQMALHLDDYPGVVFDTTAMNSLNPSPASHMFTILTDTFSGAYLATTYPPNIGQDDVHGYWHTPFSLSPSNSSSWWVHRVDLAGSDGYPLHALIYWSDPVLVNARLFRTSGQQGGRCVDALPQVQACLTEANPTPDTDWWIGVQNPYSSSPVDVSIMSSYEFVGDWEFWPDIGFDAFLPLELKGPVTEQILAPLPTPTPILAPPAPQADYPPPPTVTPGPTPVPEDNAAPISELDPLPLFQNTSAFTVSWSGYDVGGSGIKNYDVQVRIPSQGEHWNVWLWETTATSAAFDWGQDGWTYEFRCRGRDNDWHREQFPDEPEAVTTIDLTAPSSAMDSLPAYTPQSFVVSWAGQDATSGIAYYDIQICTVDCQLPQDAVWTDWITQTRFTAETFTGEHGTTYSFRSRARDNAGNQEDYPSLADTATTVDIQPPETAINPMDLYTTEEAFLVSWSGSDDFSGLDHYDIYYRDESEPHWQLWLEEVSSATTEAEFEGFPGHTYHFCSRGVDTVGNQEICPPPFVGDYDWPIESDAQIGVVPWSRVDDLPAYLAVTQFTVSWSGSPDVRAYDVEVRDGLYGEWVPWQSGVERTSAEYSGQYGHIYYFRCRAVESEMDAEELYPYDYDTYTKLVSPTGMGGPSAPVAPAFVLPPDEAPDLMEMVTQTHPIGVPVEGYIGTEGDVDWYRFELTRTMRLRIELGSLPADYDLYVFSGEGRFLWASTLGFDRAEQIVVRVPAGMYYLRLAGYAGAWSGADPYLLSADRVK